MGEQRVLPTRVHPWRHYVITIANIKFNVIFKKMFRMEIVYYHCDNFQKHNIWYLTIRSLFALFSCVLYLVLVILSVISHNMDFIYTFLWNLIWWKCHLLSHC